MSAPSLDNVFRATAYRVETGEGVFELRIGKTHPEFDGYLLRHGIDCWGLVTAYNPGGVRHDGDNPVEHRRLLAMIGKRGWFHCPASHHADDGNWPVEQGIMLMQVSEREICQLAADFSQSACVCGKIGGEARLIWVR